MKRVEFSMILCIGEFGMSVYRLEEKVIENRFELPFTVREDLDKGVDSFVKKILTPYQNKGVYLLKGSAILTLKSTTYMCDAFESLF